MPLAVAAIRFLNPAPLMWDFEHEPNSSELAERYTLRYMQPSQCAAEVLSGASDLGLIPVASLTPDLAIVPGCVIASLQEVRSILLLVKSVRKSVRHALTQVRTVATDPASRSSVAYAHVLFHYFAGVQPQFLEQPANAITMLENADAALLIGDPALLAREQRKQIDASVAAPLLWLDLAAYWKMFTGLPWVAAVWAVRPDSLAAQNISSQQLIADLTTSRDHGLAHIEELVGEWTSHLALPPETIRTYLTQNIHYTLDDDCVAAILRFRELAAAIDVLPPLPKLSFLT